MKEFIEKLIGRLEAKENEAVLKAPNTNDITNSEYQKWMMKSYGFKESISIVNQLAEEYINTSTNTSTTNADRIRSMTDEELSEFLINYKNTFGEEYEGKMSCLDWLKSEAQEEGE